MNRHDRIVLVAAVLLILLATWVRFDRIDAQSLWNDEGTSHGQSLRTAAEISANAAADIHPPGYYWLLAGWRVLTGESAFALRSLSAFASILSAVFAYALGKRLYGDSAGLIALALVAVSSFSVDYAQEIRMYALLALSGAASTWALAGVLKSPSRGRAALLALTTALGIYTHYAYAGVLAAQAVFGIAWLIAARRETSVMKTVGMVALGYGAAVLAYLPWLPTALNQVTNWGSTGEAIVPADAPVVALSWIAAGPTAPITGVSVALMLLAVLGLYNPARDENRPPPFPRLPGLILPPLWVALTVAGFFALGLYREANLKFLLPAQIAVAVWAGRGAWVLWHLPVRGDRPWFRHLPRATVVLMALALISHGLTGVGVLKSDPRFQRDDYRGIAQAIAADGQPDAAVILNAPGQIEVFRYYAREYGDTWTLAPLPVGMTVDEAATREALDVLLAGHTRIYAVLWGTDERDPQGLVEYVLSTRAYPIDENWHGDVRLARYSASKMGSSAMESGARFIFDGGYIELVDFALNAQTLKAGEALEIMLNWRADATPPANYKITMQLLTQDGALVTQRDAEPVNYRRPTTTWRPGEIITDRHALVIPNDLPAAQYRLIVGYYNPADSDSRLSVENGDTLTLATLVIED